MSEKFTKGPWKANFEDYTKPYVAILNEDNLVIAQIPDGEVIRGDKTILGLENIEANANLIAAAPDMYETLMAYEKAEADIVLNANWNTETGVPQITQEQFDRLIECQTLKARALRKARGEA